LSRSHAHLYDENAPDTGFHSTRYPEKKKEPKGQANANDPELAEEEGEEVEQPQMSVAACVTLLALVTVVCIPPLSHVSPIDTYE
jgi:hypothetical protein